MTDPVSRQSLPFGTIILAVLAFVLYVLMLASSVTPSAGGDAAMGEGIALLFLTFGLWVMLAFLLLAGGIMGEMPRWAAITAIFLHPLSGVATFTAIDSYSRHHPGAIIFPVLLPLIIASYAIWARLPSLHAKFPAKTVSRAAWISVLVLSLASLWFAAEF